MAKEFHITYSCDTEDDGAKMAISKIQRSMKDGGSELISKNGEFDGCLDLIFHNFSTYDQVTKLCNKVLDDLRNSHVHVSLYVCEHKPKILLDTTDVKDIEEYKSFIESIGKNHGMTSLKQDEKELGFLKASFEKSANRQSFQNEYTSKAANFMKQGHSSVEVFPDWEDITIIQKNNYSEQKKTTKYGY